MARTVRDLAAYRFCEELMHLVAAEAKKQPLSQQVRFCQQLNDAALDAVSDVAEGFVRYYPREFARFLDYAIASLAEVRTRTEAAYRGRLLGAESTTEILHAWARADRACRRLRVYLWRVRKEDLGPRPPRSRPQLPARHLPRPPRPGDPTE